MSEHEQPTIMVTIPTPPSLNKLWVTAPGKPRVRSAEYRAWAERAGWLLKMQIVGMAPLACRFNLDIEVPISRRDTGNHEKALCDLCESCGVVTNDGNAHHASRSRPRTVPRLPAGVPRPCRGWTACASQEQRHDVPGVCEGLPVKAKRAALTWKAARVTGYRARGLRGGLFAASDAILAPDEAAQPRGHRDGYPASRHA